MELTDAERIERLEQMRHQAADYLRSVDTETNEPLQADVVEEVLAILNRSIPLDA